MVYVDLITYSADSGISVSVHRSHRLGTSKTISRIRLKIGPNENNEFGETDNKFTERSMTLAEMTAHIGTTQEMVCRHLYRFAEKGAIEIRRTEIKIDDRNFIQDQFQTS